MTDAQLFAIAPKELNMARLMAHRAAQHLTKAARANLPAQNDDSHSNLGWGNARKSFVSHSMKGGYVGLSFSPFSLFVLDQNGSKSDLPLDGVSDKDADLWLDDQLISMGLNKASHIELPYELPKEAVAKSVYREGEFEEHLGALAAWFDVANQTLTKLVDANTHLRPGPSPVRCWPHHFDIATYVALETGDPETARGIGVGLSPGDPTYAEPYFYINPWPHLSVDALPAAIRPGHWHTDGYVGLTATASELLTTKTPSQAIANFVEKGFGLALEAQGFS